MKKILTVSVTISRLLLHLTSQCGAVPQTSFLKEIATGRCFQRPPNGSMGNPLGCPDLINSLFGVLEGHDDDDISIDDYMSFFLLADFTSPPNKALFWLGEKDGNLRTIGDPSSIPNFHFPSWFVRLVDTPGGALMSDLVFCGKNRLNDCPFGEWDSTLDNGIGGWRGAQGAFWSGAYLAYATQVTGRVKVVLDIGSIDDDTNSNIDKKNEGTGNNLWKSSIAPHLKPSKISTVHILLVNTSITPSSSSSHQKTAPLKDSILSCDSYPSVSSLTQDLLHRGFSPDRITCTPDPLLLNLLFCDEPPCGQFSNIYEYRTPSCDELCMGSHTVLEILIFGMILIASVAFWIKRFRIFGTYPYQSLPQGVVRYQEWPKE